MTARPSVLLATRSAGKLRELHAWFSAAGIGVQTLVDVNLAESAEEEALEAFDTFEANALAKARWFHGQSGGHTVVADDSGLEVAALDGAPGVRSKRWSGHDGRDGIGLDDANNAHLQNMLWRAALSGHRSRQARYVCAAACVWSGGEIVVRGATNGVIASVARGHGGFGYDPYFVSDELGITFAEATREQKSAVSHRGRAFAALVGKLIEPGGCPEFLSDKHLGG